MHDVGGLKYDEQCVGGEEGRSLHFDSAVDVVDGTDFLGFAEVENEDGYVEDGMNVEVYNVQHENYIEKDDGYYRDQDVDNVDTFVRGDVVEQEAGNNDVAAVGIS